MADTNEIADHVATSTGLPPNVARAAVMSTLTKVAAEPMHTGDGVLLVGGGQPSSQTPPPSQQTPAQTTSPQTPPPAVDETKQCPVCGQTLANGYVCMPVGPGLFLYSSACGFMKYRFAR